MYKLAIVIPAYKAKFFSKALQSLADQTNQNFTVYIGDDCSKEDIAGIYNSYKNKLNIVYHRFEKNLGGTDLVSHWNRCVSMIGPEEWVWVFSDDDIAEPGCVDFFYKALGVTNCYYDVYRFDTITIDKEDIIIAISPENPVIENHFDLTYNLLLGLRGNSMPDHIFSVERFKSFGGFVNFSFAQASDFASSIKFANPKGLYTIKGPKVKWRFSGINISSIASMIKKEAIFGHIEYIEWIEKEFNVVELQKQRIYNHNLSIELLINNLTETIKTHYKGIPNAKFFTVVKKIGKIFGWNFARTSFYCFKINADIFLKKKRHLLSGRYLIKEIFKGRY